jgi:hypothetical protein
MYSATVGGEVFEAMCKKGLGGGEEAKVMQ